MQGEAEKCLQCREIVKNIDWDCKVITLFREDNLGCKKSVSGAINWFFDQVVEGIILEDDCVPDPSFFLYCEELLAKYRYDTRVTHISGTNFLFNQVQHAYSYYFSNYLSIWGWASWSRAWKLYDPEMANWPLYKSQKLLANVLSDPIEVNYFTGFFDTIYEGKFDTWDLQWFYANFFHRGMSIFPSVNLVSNIGFGPGATHTHHENRCSNVPVERLYTLIHPPYMVVDKKSDEINFNISFNGSELRAQKKIQYKVKNLGNKVLNKIKFFLR